MKHFYQLVLSCALLLGLSIPANASHLMGGEINYKCVGGNDYVITLSLYRDCAGITIANTQSVSISAPSCGQAITTSLPVVYSAEVTPNCPGTVTTCNGGTVPGMELWVYQDTVTLGANCANWTIAWSSCCRNMAITNLVNAGSEAMYLEARLDNLNVSCNTSPVIMGAPVNQMCVNNMFCMQNTAYDADGDSLVYSLQDALSSVGVPIAYNAGYSATAPFTSSTGNNFDPTTGNLCITPSQLEVGVVSVRVDEYRNGQWIGAIFRDIQIAVLNCNPTVYSVSGTVYDTTGATAPQGTWIELWQYNVNAASMLLLRDTSVDANGDYFFANVPYGQYAVRSVPNPFQLPGHATTYYVNTGYWENAVLLHTICDTNYVADVDLVGVGNLLGSGSINGYLASYGIVRSSYPAPDVDVYLDLNGTPIAHTRSDANGNYDFQNVPAGTYTIKVDVPGVGMISTHTLTMTASGTTVTGADFTLQAWGIEAVDNLNVIHTGVDELWEGSTLNLFPNPSADGIFNLSVDGGAEATQAVISLFDIAGKLLLEQQTTLSSTPIQLNFSDQSAGSYLITITDERRTISRRIAITR